MAQKIITFCDVCQASDNDSPADPVEISVDGKAARVIDLCDDHRAEIVEELLSVLAEHGRPTGAPGLAAPADRERRRSAGRPRADAEVAWTCEVCGWHTSSTTRGPKNKHLRDEHNTDLSAVEQFGVEAALAGAGMRYACALAACKGSGRRFGAAQGFTAHLTSAHQLTLEEARKAVKDMEIPLEQRWSA